MLQFIHYLVDCRATDSKLFGKTALRRKTTVYRRLPYHLKESFLKQLSTSLVVCVLYIHKFSANYIFYSNGLYHLIIS